MKLEKLKSFIKSENGYTTAEGLVAILIVAALGLSGAFTFRKIEQNKNDIKLKTNIESTYYGLEYFHTLNKYYPEELKADSMLWLNPESLKREDKLASKDNADYKYQPEGCKDAKCTSYQLSIKLKDGSTITKKSKN